MKPSIPTEMGRDSYLTHLEGGEASELRFLSLLEEEFLHFMAAVLESYSGLPTPGQLVKQFTESLQIHNHQIHLK